MKHLAWFAPLALALCAHGQDPASTLTAEQAEQALAQGKAEVAADAFLALVKAEPQESKWVLRAVEALGRAGRYNDALECLDKACQRFTDRADLRVLVAKVNMLQAESLARGGRVDSAVIFAYEDAARIAREVVGKEPGNRDARLILGEAEYSLGNYDSALAEAREAKQRFPDHPGGHILTAKVHFQRLVNLRQQLGEQAPRSKDAERLAKDAAAARKEALTSLEAAVAIDGQRAFPHKLIGDIYAWSDNPAQALAAYGKALSLDPGVALSHEWLQQHTKPDALRATYRDALAHYAARPGADVKKGALLSFWIGASLFRDKKYPEAKQEMLAAFRANPEFTNCLYYVWTSSYWQGDHNSAELEAAVYADQQPVAFADLLRTLPDRAQTTPILKFLADRAFKAGRAAQSAAINHVLALVEDSADAWNNYAFLCRESGKYEASLSAYERALEREPESPQLLNDTAVVLHYHLPDAKNKERARALYEHAIAMAKKAIAGGNLDEVERARVEQGARDAKANLEKLGPR